MFTEPDDHGLGRSRGGFTTKLHLAVEQGQKPMAIVITAGQRGDSPQFEPVLEKVRVPRIGPGPATRPPRSGVGGRGVAVAGDSVGGNMSAVLTLLAKERGGLTLAHQVLFYPVTDARFDTDSYRQFAEGYFLRRDGMQWFSDQYTTDESQRAEITASPCGPPSSSSAAFPRRW